MKRVARTFFACAVLFALALPARPGVAAPSELPIQPGAVLYTPIGQCTMNFVYHDAAGVRYIGTAGHCGSLGDRVEASFPGGRDEFGTISWHRFSGATDFALIRIDTNRYGDVSPAMRRWGGPTGVASTEALQGGETVLLHGFGIGFGATPVTRPRAGVLVRETGSHYHAEAPAIFGDSGGPVLLGDGQALGIVNYLASPTILNGNTMDWCLGRVAATGLSLTLETAPFSILP